MTPAKDRSAAYRQRQQERVQRYEAALKLIASPPEMIGLVTVPFLRGVASIALNPNPRSEK